MRTWCSSHDCMDSYQARKPHFHIFYSFFFFFNFSLPVHLQRSLLLPDHRHPGVPAGLSMLTDPSHRHTRVHPRLCRGQQRTQRARFLRVHRPAAQPHQRLQPWTWTHCQSLPVSPSVHVLCVCIIVWRGEAPPALSVVEDKRWRRAV